MAENKKSFILYKDWINVVEKLNPSQAGVLFKSILGFVNNEYVSIEDEIVEPIYLAITEQIVYEWSKFNPKTNKYHWNYKGGITPENKVIRNSEKIKFWRHHVFERDNYTCQKCNKKGGLLNAHHIKEFAKFPELRTVVSNGLTLCVICHRKEHSKEKKGVTNEQL